MSESLALKGDYMGFTYNGVHSSELGIVRTSDGSRFNENLLPTIQDKTVQVPGRDGTYFFGSYYTQRQLSVPFAFDSLTESDIRNLKALLGDKQVHELIFDEAPYKTYRAKVTGTAQIKHLVFDEGAGKERVYKGEGTVQFTCYEPYALCKNKWLKDYEAYENVHEWAEASGLKEEQGACDRLNSNKIPLYNPGDIDSHFLISFMFANDTIPAGKISIEDGEIIRQLQWDEIQAEGEDTKIVFNSRLNLIEGYAGTAKSGCIYNKYITAGEFFTIPRGESELVLSGDGSLSSYVSQSNNSHIQYSYYYL